MTHCGQCREVIASCWSAAGSGICWTFIERALKLPGHVSAIMQHVFATVIGCQSQGQRHHLSNSLLG